MSISNDKLTPSEALFGFAAWLTSRDEVITASSGHDAGDWARAVDEFCKANNLEECRDDYTKNLTFPKDKEK